MKIVVETGSAAKRVPRLPTSILMKFPRITLAALLTASMVFAFTPNLLARGNNDTKDRKSVV